MRWLRWLATPVALLALLASCTATAPLPSPSPTPSVTASAPSDTNPTARSRIAEGGIVRVPLASLPAAWNPWHPRGRATESVLARGPLSQGTFLFDAAGRPGANPNFLSGVSAAHDGGRTVVTLDLNPRAVWSDGAAITSADWVATWEALRGSDPGLQVADDRGWAGVAEVRAGTSTHQVVVTFAAVEPDWSRPLAAGPARAESVRDAATFNSGWPEYQAGWFSGPFVLGHADRTQGVLTYDRNPLWWGETPKLDHVVFRTIQPEAVGAAFQNNEFDWLRVDTPAHLAKVRAAADTTVREAPGTQGRLLRLDTAGTLADAGLRTALLRALDRAALARADLGALTSSPLTWGNHLLLTNQPGYVDQSVATGLGHDRAAAAEAFTRAGWPLAAGRRTRDGVPLALTMAVPPGDAWATAEFMAVAATLSDLGVEVTRTTGAADITPATVTFDAYPYAGVRTLTDPGAAALVARVAGEVSPVRRADLASQVSRVLWTSAETIPVHQPPQVVAVRNGLANLGAAGFASVRWEDVGWAR